MSKNIALRRVFEITVRLVSVLFAVEVLFALMYALSVLPQANQSFRQLVFRIQNIMGISVSVVCLILIVMSLVIVFVDKKFPVAGFIASVAEFMISVLITLLISVIELAVFKGVEVLI